MSLLENPHEKQGFLGDLHTKPTPEILDLLKRQQTILKNVKFIRRLPDRGAKLLSMIDRLEEILQQRKDVNKTADLFEKMAIDAETSQQTRLISQHNEDGEDDEDDYPLKHLVNKGYQDKIVNDERSEKFLNSYERVIKRTSDRQESNQTKAQHPAKFMPHRTVKSKGISELSERLDIMELKSCPTTHSIDFDPTEGHMPVDNSANKDSISQEQTSGGDSCSVLNKGSLPERTNPDSNPESSSEADTLKQTTSTFTKQCKNKAPEKEFSSREVKSKPVTAHQLKELGCQAGMKLKYRYDESLLTSSPPKFSSTKVIDIEDAINLQQQQKHIQEELQAKQAAQKLAQKLNIKMTAFSPEGSSQQTYRDQAVAEEKVDSDEEEMDYPE